MALVPKEGSLPSEILPRFAILAAILLGAGSLAACDNKESTSEKIGEAVEDAGDEAGDAIEDAGDAVGDAAEEVGEKAQDAVQ